MPFQKLSTRGASRHWPACSFVLPLVLTSLLFASGKTPLVLEKTQELFVKDFHLPPGRSLKIGLSTTSFWTQTANGYILRTPNRLYFYSPSLELKNMVSLLNPGAMGSTDLKLVDDTLVYILDMNALSVYDLEGNLLRNSLYASHAIHGYSLAVSEDYVVIAGAEMEPRDSVLYSHPRFLIYDTETNDAPIVYDSLLPKSKLDYLNFTADASGFITANVTAYKDEFIVVSGTDPEIFFFSETGKSEGLIKNIPTEYKSIYNDPKPGNWDFQGFAGIARFNDSLLIVPRHTASPPYWLDIYNLKERSFLMRLEAPAPLIGVSKGQVFLADSATSNFLKISVYRLLPPPDTIFLNDSTAIERFLKTESGSSCSGESGCCSPTKPFEHVQCAPNKLFAVDTVPAGSNRFARVVCNYAFAPDSLFQFCDSKRKNMFVFVSPASNAGYKLLDTLHTYLKDDKTWLLTTVVCYPAPKDLDLYLRDIKGEQILINRCVSVPDSTLALTDLGLPPLALALTEGGSEFLAGYSLEPTFDPLKIERKAGFTLAEFLQRCGITE